MAKIIRCILPDGVHRFEPFKVSDYRDFVLVAADLVNHDKETQAVLINELVDDYFGEYPKAWRHYMFLKVLTGSIGNTKIPVVYECPKCGAKIDAIFNIEQGPLQEPEVEVAGLKIKFNLPEDLDLDDLAETIERTIKSVEQNGRVWAWEDIDDNLKVDIVNAIDLETFENIISQMKPIYFRLRIGHCGVRHVITYDSLLSVFKVLFSPEEVFMFYKINHVASKAGYSTSDLMNMIPVERAFILSMIEKDNKQ